MPNLKPFAFVLMPFSKEFDDIYKLGVQAVATELGVVAERVDEQIYTENMLERIYRQIEAADFIIADMTGRNPNVFYEVGYAHAKGKLCTLLTQSADDIPFDLKHRRHLVYGSSIHNLRSMLSAEVAWLKEETDKARTSTVSVAVTSTETTLSKTDYRDEGKLYITIDIHNRSEKKTPEIEAIYLYTGGGWVFSLAGETCPSTKGELEDYAKRHFIRTPVSRLSPGTWAQLRLQGEKTLWSKFRGQERKESYPMAGRVLLEIVTAEGNFREILNLDVEFDEIPF